MMRVKTPLNVPLSWAYRLNDDGNYERRWWVKHLYAPLWRLWFFNVMKLQRNVYVVQPSVDSPTENPNGKE